MAPENKIPFSEIVDKLIEKSGQPEHTVHTFLASLFDQLSVDAEQNNETSLPNVGDFKVIETPERQTIDPRTGQRITRPPQRRLTFQPTKGVEERVNKEFAMLAETLAGTESTKPEDLKEPDETDEWYDSGLQHEPEPEEEYIPVQVEPLFGYVEKERKKTRFWIIVVGFFFLIVLSGFIISLFPGLAESLLDLLPF